MGFRDVFSGAGASVGGGVTAGKEPWKAEAPTTTTMFNKKPKPMILFPALTDAAEAQTFLGHMAEILARESGSAASVMTDIGHFGQVVEPEAGLRWLPDFTVYNFGGLSQALEWAGFDPTKCAVQPYRAVVDGGPSGAVKWAKEGALVVRLVHGSPGSERVYEGRHNLELSMASPMVFATDVRMFLGIK